MPAPEDACDLADKTCVPCRGGVPPLSASEVARLLERIDGWDAPRNHHLTRTWRFPDFAGALAFVNRIGALAEEQGHHPDVWLARGKVRVDLWTHKIDGLTESDFILAAKIDRAAR
jgi:4a-hydroxytetrahydrobiopterin dehydratase